MIHLSTSDLIIFLVSFFGGGGLGFVFIKLFIKNEARNAIEPDIKNLKAADDSLHKRINFIENEYVTCKYCDMQHSNLDTLLNSMDRKLDKLIDIKMGEKF